MLELSNFGQNVKMKVRENQRKSSKIFEISRVFLPKEVRNVQGNEEFVRAIEKFEKLSIRVFES